ncbi:hypothetical protein DPMN_068655 [Dreissena polymorpha]|uniref:Uncharacterized protein n=1 Tax=Dreissena polymorpha TaxID=45954 RepID=A0A9D3YXL0_DREPO|nr:hypothetical protein DPMN_068655 [Dreissena polymorpha]
MSKFHEDNVSSRLFTCFHFIHIKKTAPPPGAYVFPLITTIFKLVRDIDIANAKNVTSREKDPPGRHVSLPIQTIFELNCRIQVWYCVNRSWDALYNITRVLTSGNVFQPTGIIFELVQDIIGMNVLTKFHEDRTINVASRVKNAPPLGSHVFQAKATIFEVIQDIIWTNNMSKFHEDWKINVDSRVKCPAPGGHVFQSTGIIFELVQDVIGIDLLTKFHEDWAINVVSRVLTRFYYSHLSKNAPSLGSHVFQANVTIFELIQDIIKTNLLT